MSKIKISKIKLDRKSAWYTILIVLFVSLVVIFTLNVYAFRKTKRELGMDADKVVFNPLFLRNDLLEQMIAGIEERQATFENIILFKPEIKDPYGVEEEL